MHAIEEMHATELAPGASGRHPHPVLACSGCIYVDEMQRFRRVPASVHLLSESVSISVVSRTEVAAFSEQCLCLGSAMSGDSDEMRDRGTPVQSD